MTAGEVTTARPDDATTSSDRYAEALKLSDEYYEPEHVRVRQELNLRPTVLAAHGGPHLDERKCPSWCWLGRCGYDHEVDPERPTGAVHFHDGHANVLASAYAGWVSCDEEPSRTVVHTAVMEVRLEQEGQARPRIKVALRFGGFKDPFKWAYHDDQLSLDVEDAIELAAALRYFAEMAAAG